MKIYISQKNSKWKVVQNPLKGNFYTDVINFKNDEDKDLFLQQNVSTDWKDVSKYIDVKDTWDDEIHFNFIADLKLLNMTRNKALRCDFAIVYDETDAEHPYRFYTLEAHLPEQQNRSTIAFQAELDVFFTYGIDNIWKENAQINIERGVVPNQWTNLKPNIQIDSLLNVDEGIENTTFLNNTTKYFDGNQVGYLVFIKPQKRVIPTYITLSSANGIKINTGWYDTIALQAYTNNNTIINYIIAVQTHATSVNNFNKYLATGLPIGSGQMIPATYPQFQMIDDHKKQDKYICLYIDNTEINNIIDSNFPFTIVSDIFNSPDVIQIIPTNKVPTYTQLDSLTINDKSATNATHFVNQNDNIYYPDKWNGYNFKLVGSNYKWQESSGNINIAINNNLTSNLYDANQYAKIYSENYEFWRLINSTKQKLDINRTLLDSTVFSFNRQNIITLEGNFSKVNINQGEYLKGTLRNNYTLEGSNNIKGFQNTDKWLQYATDNAQSFNNAARIQNRDGIFGIVSGITNVGLSSSIGINSLPPLVHAQNDRTHAMNQRRSDSNFYTNIQNKANKYLPPKIMKGMAPYNESLYSGSPISSLALLNNIGNIITGAQSLLHSHDAINSQASLLRSQQSGKNSIVNTGSEYDRLVYLDNPWSIELQYWNTPSKLKDQLGQHFHKFGYKLPSLSDTPKNWLNNGRYWDYFQAEFNSIYQAFNETLSPQESKIAALSISSGIRVWHWDSNVPEDWEVGNYKYRNIIN